MNTLTILNHSNFSIRFTIFYPTKRTLSVISSSYYGNGKYETMPLPDEILINFSIQIISNNIVNNIFNYEFFNDSDKAFELIGTSKDNFKVFGLNLSYLNEKKKYIYISNTISSIVSCNINFTVIKTNYSFSFPIIHKNKFRIFHFPVKSKEITIEFLAETSNEKLTVFARRNLNDYQELPKCYEINKPLFSSLIYAKEITCKNKFNA